MRKDRQWSRDHFIEEAQNIHSNKYDYSKVEYTNQNTKVIIICPTHGEYRQIPSAHLRGQGCPCCSGSKGELQVANYLDSLKIEYKREYTIPIPIEIRETGICKVDFYVPSSNIIIEYNGIQHYHPHVYFGGENGFKKQQLRDNYLKEYCSKNKLTLVEIKYNENVTEILDKIEWKK